MTPMPPRVSADAPNSQTAERFAAERAAIDEAAVPLTWTRPSDHDPDRIPMTEAIALEPGDAPDVDALVGAGRIRGLVLHKLMEEVLTGELVDDVGGFAGRARELLTELVLDSEGDALPDANEIAITALRSLELPEIAALRGRLIPEWPIYARLADGPGRKALAGRIDAIAFSGERADVVVDWKSDIDPSEDDMHLHAGQLEDYLRVTGAARGALVYMTLGVVRWVTIRPNV
jgi:hypothetical protein